MTGKASFLGKGRGAMVILTVILAGILLYQFGYVAVEKNFKALKNKTQVAERRLEKNLSLIRQAESVREKYRPLLADYQQKNSTEEVMSDLLSDIQEVSNRMGVPITDLKPSKVRQEGAFNHYSVSLAVEGDLKGIMHFIYLLQNPPYEFFVDDLHLRREYSKSKELRCQIVFKKIFIP